MYPLWAADVSGAGFSGIETFSYDVEVPYTHVAWRGRIRASAGVAASLPAEAVESFDNEHAAMLAERFAERTIGGPAPRLGFGRLGPESLIAQSLLCC